VNSLSTDLVDQILVASIFILGIPHGAIDNILMKRRTGWTTSRFYAFYLGLILLNVALWFIYPALSLLLFLYVSAYHFGQAQMSHYFDRKSALHAILYFSWGNLILNFFFLFKRIEIETYFKELDSFQQMAFIFDKEILQTFMLANAIILIACLIMLLIKKQIELRSLGIETLIIFMVATIAYLYHFVFGFAIFFILLHAVPVLLEEYAEFYSRFSWRSMFDFLKMLSPFTFLSLFGIFLLFAMKEYGYLNLPYLLLILIAGSSITLPHVWVMKKFYRE
jgi:Brp/Blh family beta-carotene 15,15'-monooxygenase